jgi:hypothetical protein
MQRKGAAATPAKSDKTEKSDKPEAKAAPSGTPAPAPAQPLAAGPRA